MASHRVRTTFRGLMDQGLVYYERDPYFAPLSRPEGPRCCHGRGNAGGALVFFGTFGYYRLLEVTIGYYMLL